MTGDNIGRKMAILLDDKINSAPVIEGASARAAASRWAASAIRSRCSRRPRTWSAVLRSGALPAPLRKTFETQVGPTMGRDSVEKAKFSMIIGAAAVVLFMLIYYRVSGAHRERRHDPEHAVHDGDPGGLRGLADAARASRAWC